MKKAIIPIADGVEEMEAVILVDVLRRANWTVCVAGLRPGLVQASHGVQLMPDAQWEEVCLTDMDWIVLPGGLPGTEQLMHDERVQQALRDHAALGRGIAAVCAAPLALQEADLLIDRTYTSHPSVAERLTQGTRVDERVVVDGNLITSQGPGTCFEMALTLVGTSESPDTVSELAQALRLHPIL